MLMGLRFFFVIVLLLLGSVNVLAQQPGATVSVAWRPGSQLSSIVGDDRYVDLEIALIGNVPFWAINLSCVIGNGSQLTPYPSSADFITWGPEWTASGPGSYLAQGSYAGNGTMNYAVTRVGSQLSAIGNPGAMQRFLLLTARFRVNNLSSVANVAVNCRTFDLLDRDGNVVLRPTRAPVTPLSLRPGYSIEGTILRQGARTHGNISILCNNYPDGATNPPSVNSPYSVTTDARGVFRFSSLREQGLYQCSATSSLSAGLNAQFLTSHFEFELATPTLRLQPYWLKPGDFDGNQTINVADLSLLTGNWQVTLSSPFLAGDANGDRQVDQADLALVAGNVGLSGPRLQSHVIYGIGRNYDPRFTFPNSRIWTGIAGESSVSQMTNNSNTRDFWPALSPDGTKLAYVTQDARSGRFYLQVLDVATRRVTRLTPANFAWDAFAPSWSPDGSRLAFLCSWQALDGGYEYNQGYLCFQNADDTRGNSFTLPRVLGQPVKARISPPAWYDLQAVFVGGWDAPGTACAYGSICIYDMSMSDGQNLMRPRGLALETLEAGSDTVDMPIITRLASGQAFLTYRYFVASSGSNYQLGILRMDSYIPNSNGTATISTLTARPSGTHSLNEGIPPAPIAAYDISPTMGLIYTLYATDPVFTYVAPYPTIASSLQSGPFNGAWDASAATAYRVDGQVQQPLWQSGAFGGPGIPWDWTQERTSPSLFHIYRFTYDWVP